MLTRVAKDVPWQVIRKTCRLLEFSMRQPGEPLNKLPWWIPSEGSTAVDHVRRWYSTALKVCFRCKGYHTQLHQRVIRPRLQGLSDPEERNTREEQVGFRGVSRRIRIRSSHREAFQVLPGRTRRRPLRASPAGGQEQARK